MHRIAHYENFCIHSSYVLKQFSFNQNATGNYGNLVEAYKVAHQKWYITINRKRNLNIF
jgi:hypothetical protein